MLYKLVKNHMAISRVVFYIIVKDFNKTFTDSSKIVYYLYDLI